MEPVAVAERATHAAGAPARWQLLAAMTALHAANDFYGLVLAPLLPALREMFQLSYAQLGVIPFVGTAVSSLLQPTLGYMADRRRSRRAFMAAGFVGFALAMFWLASASSYGLILVGAAILGVASSTYHPQSATFLVHYFQSNRGFAQGIHGLGNGVGFLLAPVAVTVLLPVLGWLWTVRLLALPALAAVVLVLLVLREPPFRGSAGLMAGVTGSVMLLTLVTGLGLFSSFGFLTWLPSYYAARGYSLTQAGLFTAALVASSMVAQPVGGTLSDRLGRRAVALLSLSGVGLFQLAFLTTDFLPLMIGLSLLAGFFSSLFPSVTMVYASEMVGRERTGTAVGVVWGLGISISSIAPLTAGFVIDGFGFGVAYAALSLVALLAAGLALRLPR